MSEENNDGPLTLAQILEIMAALARGQADHNLCSRDLAWLAELVKERGFKP